MISDNVIEKALTEIASLRSRVAHLEKLEYMAHASLADVATTALALTDAFMLLDYGGAASGAGVWTIAASAGTREADPANSIALTVPAGKTATVLLVCQMRVIDVTVARAAAVDAIGLLDAATGQRTGHICSPVANYYMPMVVVNYWTAVAAGNHTVTVQARRLNAGDNVQLDQRVLFAAAFEE